MDSDNTLRPCPFCAHDKPVLAAVGKDAVERIAVVCPECGAVGPMATANDRLSTFGMRALALIKTSVYARAGRTHAVWSLALLGREIGNTFEMQRPAPNRTALAAFLMAMALVGTALAGPFEDASAASWHYAFFPQLLSVQRSFFHA